MVFKAHCTENTSFLFFFLMLKSCLLKPIGATSHLLTFKTIYPFEPLESEIEVL